MSKRISTDETLNHVPITSWVLGTVEQVLRTDRDDPRTWNRCWYEQYKELGGMNKNSGSKSCPRAAARGLWFMGRLRRGGRPLLPWTAVDVYRNLTKNAAYAVIAADLWVDNPQHCASELWPLVQAEFARLTGDSPANSEQGEVRIVVALARNNELVRR